MLGEVIVYAEAGFALVHEVLSHGNTGIRCQILQRCTVSSRSSYHDGVFHSTGLFQRFYHTGNGGGFLTDSYINTDTILVMLVENGINSDSRFTDTTVTDDKFALATADRNEGVDSLQTSLQRLLNGFTVGNTRSAVLNRAEGVSLDFALAVNRTADGINDTANHSFANRHLHDFARTLNLRTFLNLGFATQNNGTYVVLFKVQDQTIYIITKIQQLTGHSFFEAMDMGDTVTDFDNRANFINIQVYFVVLDLVFDDGRYFFRIHFHNLAVTPVSHLLVSNSFCSAWRRPATLPSIRRSPILTTTPPNRALFSWRRSSTFFPVTASSLAAIFCCCASVAG